MNETVRAMLEDDGAPTAPLDDFVAEYEQNDNLWWYLDSGHHQNLFEAATERIEQTRTRVEALLNAEQIALHSPMSRQERACRKATRDAYALVLDMMSEET